MILVSLDISLGTSLDIFRAQSKILIRLVNNCVGTITELTNLETTPDFIRQDLSLS